MKTLSGSFDDSASLPMAPKVFILFESFVDFGSEYKMSKIKLHE